MGVFRTIRQFFAWLFGSDPQDRRYARRDSWIGKAKPGRR